MKYIFFIKKDKAYYVKKTCTKFNGVDFH